MTANFMGAKITFTGHSLGGAEAQVQAARLAGSAVTFGAPGASFAATPEQLQQAKNRVVNYVLPGDPVPMSGQHIGTTVVIRPNGFTVLKIVGSLVVGAIVTGPLGILIAALGPATTHMLGSYIGTWQG
jgi:Lipase (class 3)